MQIIDRLRITKRFVRRNGLPRRGLLGMSVALTAAGIARLGAIPAKAADLGNFILGANNLATTTTTLARTNGGTNAPGLSITNNNGIALLASSSNSVGTYATSTTGIGVQGVSTSSLGVLGFSSTGVGVQGQSDVNIGLFGLSNSGVGLFGFSTSNVGLQGQSGSGIGMYGLSSSNVGLYGQSQTGLAGQFQGNVFVTGTLTVQGIKSATVPHPDGSHRRLYCLESPDSYFEDFGKERLVSGVAYVHLDPDFAAMVDTDDYYVFLMPTSDCNGLFVSAQNSTGFEVRELRSGKRTISFSYRVVARRKDIQARRLEHVELPREHTPIDVQTLVQQAARIPNAAQIP